jgi:hypothetical protein
MFGSIFVFLIAGVTIWLTQKYKEIAWAIAIAFIFRISTTLINLYVVTLPDGGVDATGFEYFSWAWGKDGLIVAYSHFFEKGMPWTYSNVGSLFYAIFGRDPLILQSISVIAGVYCVVLTWKLSMQVWSSHSTAKTSAWLVAIYPILILYSSLTMREVFITMLLLYSLLYVILWVKTNKLIYALIALIAFSIQLFFHPGVASASVLFLGLLFLYYIKTLFFSLSPKSSINVRSFLIVMLCLVLGFYIYLYASSLAFPYSNWLKVDTFIWMTSIMQGGDAAYPSWIIADTPKQFFWLLVPKLFYFLFSPFPWDITKLKHLLGMLDGVAYLMLLISIFSHRKYIKSNPRALILLLFFIFLSLIFTMAVGNFGTGVRHRSKILPIIIILASPFVYRLLFFMKKKLKLE